MTVLGPADVTLGNDVGIMAVFGAAKGTGGSDRPPGARGIDPLVGISNGPPSVAPACHCSRHPLSHLQWILRLSSRLEGINAIDTREMGERNSVS
jgi:hypothetical protein